MIKDALYFNKFKEHCKHNGWTCYDEEKEQSQVMCSLKTNKTLAKCWEEWSPCSFQHCPILKEE